MTGVPTVSVVVISYNYAEYLPMAIDSVLAQTCPPLEILVVDDGSTDGSPEIISGYSDRVRALSKQNGGNSSVVNFAVPRTSGDIVMFLDADDVLDADAVRRVRAAWRDGCAKVQFRLALIDATGVRHGVSPAAHVRMPDGDMVPSIAAHGRYVTPVTTGNGFSRRVLLQLLPIPDAEFRNTNDGYLNPLCAFYGEVVSIDAELGSYRLHGRNLWAFSGEVTVQRLHDRIRHDLARQRELTATAARRGRDLPDEVILRSAQHVLVRLGSLRWDRASHPAPGDVRRRLVVAGLLALRGDPELTGAERGYHAVVLCAVATLPTVLARKVLTSVLASRPRPRLLRFVARLLRRI
ncbi:MAG: glycosyltransferase family 2 protein [Sciscionella sp.]